VLTAVLAVDPRQKRLAENPLADVAGPDPREDPRHDRRAFTLDELRRLLAATSSSGMVWRGLTGPDRHYLYLTAAATGFRRKELSALTPACFDLDGDYPTASLPGKRTKNKRFATQPLPLDVAEALRGYLSGRPAEAPVWPGLLAVIDAFRCDLEAAGIPNVIDGPEEPLYADLHSLRHSYVLLLDQAGVTVKQAMRLARHSDPRLTVARYGRPQLGDLASAVAKLPALASPRRLGVLRATGTDGATGPKTGPSLAPEVAPAISGDGCRPMATDRTDEQSKGTQLPSGSALSMVGDTDGCRAVAITKNPRTALGTVAVTGFSFFMRISR
jgi:Phage integrase family